MAERTSTDVLVEDLLAAQAPDFMLSKAREGQYNDYLSQSATPIMDLVHDAVEANLRAIADQAQTGKYDATQAEASAWFEREGRHMWKDDPR